MLNAQDWPSVEERRWHHVFACELSNPKRDELRSLFVQIHQQRPVAPSIGVKTARSLQLTAHSSQLTAHSSQLAAHSSQLTAHR